MDMTMILPALAGFFLLSVVFYLCRFVARAYVTSVNGYFDRENEFWHAACLAGMTACLAPTWFNIPDAVWIWMSLGAPVVADDQQRHRRLSAMMQLSIPPDFAQLGDTNGCLWW